MNLILLSEQDLVAADTVRLGGRRLDHVLKVHKPEVGDTLRVGMIDGLLGLGTVTELHESHVAMTVALSTQPPKPLPITLLLALPRPKNLPRILQTITSLGVKDIHVFHSYQVEKSFWTSDYLSEPSVHESLLLGLEQARDTMLPQVKFHRYFKPFVEDEVPSISKDSSRFVAHPVANEGCPAGLACTDNDQPNITLAVGPEGGFIDYEVDKFVEAGFKVIKLGERILKVEPAVVSLISRLS